MKILVYGGTFNPIHIGHIKMLEKAMDNLKPDITMLIPNYIAVHKQVFGASSEDRLEMCRLAFSDCDNVQVSDIEIKKHDRSYTYQTLEMIKEEYPEAEIYFFMGADSLFDFLSWNKPDEILKLACLYVVQRDDMDRERLEQQKALLKSMYNYAKIIICDTERIDVSSSQIRKGIDNSDANVYELVPSEVAKYIQEKNLYKKCEC